MPGNAFAELEEAREAVLAEGARFVEELEPVLSDSLRIGVDRVLAAQAERLARLDLAERAAVNDAVDRAIVAGVARVIERLRAPDIWLAPFTARGAINVVEEQGWPTWVPDAIARWLDRRRRAHTMTLGKLDDPTNRIWVAVLGAVGPVDPVLEGSGFRAGRRRMGGRFGVGPRSLHELDPSARLRDPWRGYRAAFERLRTLTEDVHDDPGSGRAAEPTG